MKILFLDGCGWAYDTTTPLTKPMGGTQSAIVYLSRLLAQSSHHISVINGTTTPNETEGVQFLGLPCPVDILNSFDVIVVVARACARMLRNLGCTKPMVLWAVHATDQPAVRDLLDPQERDLYSGFAMVSDWQAQTYRTAFQLDASKMRVLRNAAAPSFFDVNPAPRWYQTGKPPVLGYTSTPYRGLDVLLLSFARIRQQIPGTSLRIFSSMGIYSSEIKDDFAALYDMARLLPDVQYEGSKPQPELAAAMADIDIWAYPCTFPETSCISAMEAMATGQILISTQLGALPETTGGFAHLTDLQHQGLTGIAATHFADHLIATVRAVESDPIGSDIRRQQQMAFARTKCSWNARATEWIDWLQQII